LANIKSAIKQIRTSEQRRLRNRVHLSGARGTVKRARQAVEGGKWEDARTATMEAIAALDRAAQKGVIHANNAARRKSRLMKSLNALKPA
jgi:small subunit ribosomal protein S20